MNYTAAIHVLKGLLQLSDDDYRALLIQLVGKASCKAMSVKELALVRKHLDGLATRMGVQTPPPARLVDAPQVRKLRAMWWALADVAAVEKPANALACAKAVEAWAVRQASQGAVGAFSALRFATPAQLNKLIEEMKRWGERVGAKVL
jgi:phage gp16-like protein